MSQTDFIYMDHAAATPVDPDVLAAMLPYFGEKFYNPSALYLPAQAIAKDILAARTQVASVLGSRPAEIIFTAGGTEANNVAVHGVMRRFPNANVVASSIEHDSILEPIKSYDHHIAPVNQQGIISLDTLTASIDDKTVLVSVMYANNEIGSVQPIKEITEIIIGIRKDRRERHIEMPLYFHTDAAQASNYLDLHVSRLGIDLMTLNGGKIYGPKQSGVLYIRGGLQLEPLISGGGQEHGLRSGTENVANAVGFAHALQAAQILRTTEVKRLQELQALFISKVAARFPDTKLNGSSKKRLPNNIHFTFPGTDNERLLIQLEEMGVLAAAGSACSASNDEPSHVLRAIGLCDQDAQASLRFTLGRSTTEADATTAVNALATILTA